MEGDTDAAEGLSRLAKDVGGGKAMIEAAVAEVGGRVGGTGGADASILEDAVVVGDNLEEDKGEGVVGGAEVGVGGGGGGWQRRTAGEAMEPHYYLLGEGVVREDVAAPPRTAAIDERWKQVVRVRSTLEEKAASGRTRGMTTVWERWKQAVPTGFARAARDTGPLEHREDDHRFWGLQLGFRPIEANEGSQGGGSALEKTALRSALERWKPAARVRGWVGVGGLWLGFHPTEVD